MTRPRPRTSSDHNSDHGLDERARHCSSAYVTYVQEYSGVATRRDTKRTLGMELEFDSPPSPPNPTVVTDTRALKFRALSFCPVAVCHGISSNVVGAGAE
jgi:hypothetical protein